MPRKICLRGRGRSCPADAQMFVMNLPFQFFRSNPKTCPFLLSQQPPSRTASDQQIRSSSKLHLQLQQQRTATGATRSTSSQLSDTATPTEHGKKHGFTLASPVVVSQEIEGEGDSDEWISSESLSVTPQNQSSDSESDDEDDDVVRNLPANLNLTGAAHVATSPDDREPPTPTVPQARIQPPTPVNNVKEQPRHRSLIPVGGHDRERSVVSTANDQETMGDHDYPPHHARLEEGLASTPRPRATVDRDTEPSRHLLPAPLSNPPLGPDSTAQKLSVVSSRLRGGVQDRLQQSTSSVHSAPQLHRHITSDRSPGLKADNNPLSRDNIAMTQVSEDPLIRITTKPSYV